MRARLLAALGPLPITGWLLIAACSAPRGPAPASADLSPGDPSRPVRTRLYFGLASPQGPVDSAAFALFVDTAITPRFPDGLTVFAAQGQWRGRDGATLKEPSRVVEIIRPAGDSARAKVAAIVGSYKRRFAQEAVMVVEDRPAVEFP